jgi:hypothetical protein
MTQAIAKPGKPAGPVLGIETSCDETGVAIFDPAHVDPARHDAGRGLLAHTLYSQIRMHADYGGVVPELASRDHVRKLLPLVRETLARAHLTTADLGGVAYTSGRAWSARCSSAPRRRARWPGRSACPRSACTTWKATCSRRCSKRTRPSRRSSPCSSRAGIPC